MEVVGVEMTKETAYAVLKTLHIGVCFLLELEDGDESTQLLLEKLERVSDVFLNLTMKYEDKYGSEECDFVSAIEVLTSNFEETVFRSAVNVLMECLNLDVVDVVF